MLFVGDDLAEDHHDIEIVDEAGQRLARQRLPEGLAGISRLHSLIAARMPAEWAELPEGEAAGRVKVGIETERGPWVQALVAAGHEVFPVNPLSVARYRQRHSTSGAKSDGADAHLLAEIVRLDRAHHRAVAGDSPQADAVKIVAALGRANRRDTVARSRQIQALLREPQLRQPPPVQAAYAATVSGYVAMIRALNSQIDELGEVVASHFGRHRDADIYASQPGLGTILSARIMAEFGDDPRRFADARARKNCAGTAPITRASGRKKIVLARYARNRRLADALHQWAFCAMRGSPGARAYYQQLRDRGIGHQAALRQLANRLVGILHGCLKTRAPYDERSAWTQHQQSAA
ncbi:MAG: transposase [Streptosporangiaceae bacterium]